MAESPSQSDANEERFIALEEKIKRMEEDAAERYLKLDNLPTIDELGYEMPVTKFETDREYLKFQKDGPNLSVWFNPDALKKSLAGGGLGGGSSTSAGIMAWGRIAGATSTGIVDFRGNPVQWLYSIVQLKPGAATDYDEWVNDPDGFLGPGYNAKEDGNNGISVQENGFDLTWTVYTENDQLMFQPIRGVVPFWLVQAQDGSVSAWFSEPNLVGGSCGSGSG